MSKEEENLHLIDDDGVLSTGEVVKSRGRLKRLCSRTCIIISVGVVLFLISAAVAGIIAAAVSSESSGRDGRQFTLDDVFNDTFDPKLYSAVWTSDGMLLHRSATTGDVTLYSPDTNTTTILIPADVMESYEVQDYKVDHSLKYVMLISKITKVYRHSFLADYHIYDVEQQTAEELSSPIEDARLQYAVWSPNANVPQICFVAGYTIFLHDIGSGVAMNITSYGLDRVAIYGIPDWVYEEEVLATNYALWWSPDGGHITYAVFNDSMVRDFNFPIYGNPDNPYTDIVSIAYPKAGTNNPVVSLVIVDVNEVTNKLLLEVPTDDVGINFYFVDVTWISASHVQVAWLNREQNTIVYTQYDIQDDGSISSQYKYISQAWVELVQPAVAYKDSILVLLSQQQGESSDGFIHIAQISWSNGDPSFLTSGEYEVTSIVATGNDDILYMSANPEPYKRHLYSTKHQKCLSCDQETWELLIDDHCDYFITSCDPSVAYCLLHCQGPRVPYSILMKYQDGELSPVMLLEDNSKLTEAIEGYRVPSVHYFTIEENNDGDPKLYGKMIRPDGFDPDKSHPTLVHVYGGPYSQMISETSIYYDSWAMYMTSEHDMIIVSVDGRGTGFRGDNFKHSVYRQLGLLETTDQIRVGEYLKALPYVDGSQLTIYGTSYGGYMAAMVGSSGSKVYSKSIVRSPVTDWKYYDSIYTERYMGQPIEEDNLIGYEESSVLPRVANFTDVDLLLIHGTADDNVHFQNAAHLMRSLTEAGIQYHLQVYTDKAHALAGEETRRHLYTLMSSFVSDKTKN